MALILFNDDGVVERVERFGVDLNPRSQNIVVGVKILSEKWHIIVSLASGSILLEVKAGPFDSNLKNFWLRGPRKGAL